MVVKGDIDRYGELQDCAWEFDRVAAERDRVAKHGGSASNGDVRRAKAQGLRVEAARMLAQYWSMNGVAPRGASSLRFDERTAREHGRP